MPIIIPVYLYLDLNLFVNIFGCGCVFPGGEKNSLGNYFNANDFRKIVFSFLPIIIITIGLLLSTKVKKRTKKLMYIFCMISINVFLAYYMINCYGWK